jgi:hypothetical protein
MEEQMSNTINRGVIGPASGVGGLGRSTSF